MTLEIETYIGVAFGIAYENDKPRKKYIYSDETIVIVLPFISIQINWSRIYKPLSKI